MSASVLFTRVHARTLSNLVKFIEGMKSPLPFANEESLNLDVISPDTDTATTTENGKSSVTSTTGTFSSIKAPQTKIKLNTSEDCCKISEDTLTKMDFTNSATLDIIHTCIDAWFMDLKIASYHETGEEAINDNTWANSEFADQDISELLRSFGDSILDPRTDVSEGYQEMSYHWERPPKQYLSTSADVQCREPRYLNAFFGRDINKINYYRDAVEFMHNQAMKRLHKISQKPKNAFNVRFPRAEEGHFSFNLWWERRKDPGKSRLWFENHWPH